MEYIHYNPVKHGYVIRAVDWPHASIHRCIADGMVGRDWGMAEDATENINGEKG